jgi:hypothetical protein
MAKKKDKIANASKARVRIASKKRSTTAKRMVKSGVRGKDAILQQPPQQLFDAKNWFGAFPELEGPTLAIQRRMRDEW